MTETQELTDVLLTGTVLRASGGLYEVDARPLDGAADDGLEATEDAEADASDEPLLCSVRGKLKHGRRATTQPVVVGDRVRVRPRTTTGMDARGRRLREGYIEEVLPRQSFLGRARYQKMTQVTVANLDQVVIVMAMREPELNTHRLDRFLVLAEAADLRAVICLNKCDLLRKRELRLESEPILQLYRGLGYTCILCSAEERSGIRDLRAELKDHISAFIGSSGVGKSSLVNEVQPGLRLWVGNVMDIGKGRHTTTEVSLHPLRRGGYIADTPGIKTVSLLEQEEVNLPQCFPEIAATQNQCRFNDCTHDHEPGCAVRAAVAENTISPARYDSYLKMLRDAQPQKN